MNEPKPDRVERSVTAHELARHGQADAPAYTIDDIAGNCPVQGHGTTADGRRFYFRARGTVLMLSVAPTPGPDGDPLSNDAWMFLQPYGTDYEAGWIAERTARAFIAWGMERYEADRGRTEYRARVEDDERRRLDDARQDYGHDVEGRTP